MDFWERSDDLLITNWVHIDMIAVFKQMASMCLRSINASGEKGATSRAERHEPGNKTPARFYDARAFGNSGANW